MSNEGNAGTSSSNNNTETPTGSTINFNIQSTAKSEEYVSHEKSPTNVSFTKLMNASFESDIEGPITRAKSIEAGLLMPQGMNHGNSIVDKNILEAAINDAAMCRKCKSVKGKLNLKSLGKQGLAETLAIVCSVCSSESVFATSQKIKDSNRTDKKGHRQAFDINHRSVLASITMGQAGLDNFCGVMNLVPPINKSAYNNTMKKLEKVSKEVAERVMNEAAERLKNIAQEQCDIEVNGENIAVKKAAITVDGTWQKRGYSSKNGAVFVMSVDTGEVLDYEVLSMVCYECRAHAMLEHGGDEYKKWWESHKANCAINHKSSSGEMETKGACAIFNRSIEKRGLVYCTMVGDGDTGCFGAVVNAVKEKYGEAYKVTKEECVGHVQKRMGTSLREYKKWMRGKKLTDGKTVGGAGRLTDRVIDSIQNYYGKAIRANKGNLNGMDNDIFAIYDHMIRDDEKPIIVQHSRCPKGKSTWCKYWKDIQEKTNTYDEDKRLPSVFQKELKPIFDRLSEEGLLKRCLLGVTQNQNEALHGILWKICPKTTFCGKRKIIIAACKALCQFNQGSSTLVEMMKLCKLKPGVNTIRALREADNRRLKSTSIKVSLKYKKCRQQLRARKHKRAEKSNENSYVPGGFGLTSTPEYSKSASQKGEAGLKKSMSVKRRPIMTKKKDCSSTNAKGCQSKKNDEPDIQFMMPMSNILLL